MKSYDAFGFAIPVWTGIIENVIQVGSLEKFPVYIFKLATEIS
jgi:hypothetical protein